MSGGQLVQSREASHAHQQAFFQNLSHDFALAILHSAKSWDPQSAFAQLTAFSAPTTLHCSCGRCRCVVTERRAGARSALLSVQDHELCAAFSAHCGPSLSHGPLSERSGEMVWVRLTTRGWFSRYPTSMRHVSMRGVGRESISLDRARLGSAGSRVAPSLQQRRGLER